MIRTYDAQAIPPDVLLQLKALTASEYSGLSCWLGHRVPGTVITWSSINCITGWCYCNEKRNGEVLLGVYVAVGWRHQSIGGVLVDHAVELYRGKRLIRFVPGTEVARRLYDHIPVECRVEDLRPPHWGVTR